MSQKPRKSSSKIKKTERTVKVYVCGVDWQHEIGECNDLIVYADIDVLKENRSCWEECGIVELEVKLSKWMEPQDIFGKVKKQLTNDQNSATVIKKEET